MNALKHIIFIFTRTKHKVNLVQTCVHKVAPLPQNIKTHCELRASYVTEACSMPHEQTRGEDVK